MMAKVVRPRPVSASLPKTGCLPYCAEYRAYAATCGFTVARRSGETALLWQAYVDSAERPRFPDRRYRYVPVEGKVAIDLFWSRSCQTSDTEAERVREVSAEFGDAVALREHCSDLPEVRANYGIWRAIFVQGQEKGWGHEAPKDGLREAIRRALALIQR